MLPRSLPAYPCSSGFVDSEFHKTSVLDFGHVDCLAAWPAEAQIAGAAAEDVDLLQDFSRGGQLDDGSFAVSSDVEVSFGVAAMAVETVVFKFLE